ncbi:MAG: GAF domain-containing protein [Spirochaetales bacterium]|nr:GAF domain-containing protein [Spirochaetales bacterium]
MGKNIVVSQASADFIIFEELSELNVFVCEDIVHQARAGFCQDCVGVFFVVADEVSLFEEFLNRHEDGILFKLIVLGFDGEFTEIDEEILPYISEVRGSSISEDEAFFLIKKAEITLNAVKISMDKQRDYLNSLVDLRLDQEDLINIGKSLSSQKDQRKLLELILSLSKKITGADAGSIYLIEDNGRGGKQLRFKTSHTFSRDMKLTEFVMEMNKRSIAGYVAVTGEVLNIPDVYKLAENPDYDFKHNPKFDIENNYFTRSMLVVPMRNHVDEVIGVIQLINCKEDSSNKINVGNEAFSIRLVEKEDFDRFVLPFDPRYGNLLEAVAGQAAVAIENNNLIQQIRSQFEEFVKASVTAIESRDPATSGHSFRVAEISVRMARAVNGVGVGYLASFSFNDTELRELEYAALLHDFGKVYIDNSIFQKEKKLFPKDFENLILRLDYLYRFVELCALEEEKKLAASSLSGGEGSAICCDESCVQSFHDKLEKIKSIKEKIVLLNEPSVVSDDPEGDLAQIIREIDEFNCVGVDGYEMEILTDVDRMNLSIKRGSLNPIERQEIESHVMHTYNFVSGIPWPPEYRRIPEIALRHHEKIDGTGYPDHLAGRESTLIQSRIISIADVFDALSASDRPYKKALPIERVLDILKSEAERGVLDMDLVELFVEQRIYLS